MIAVDAFLRNYPPFEELSQEELAEVAAAVEIEFFPAGTEILRQGGEPASHLFVIRRGAVELLDDLEVIDLLGEGEAFGHPSLTSGLEPAFSVRAHEDTLCYLIDGELSTSILATRKGLAFLSSSLLRRGVRARDIRASDRIDPRLIRVAALIRRSPVTCRADDSVQDAARRMADERVSSLVVMGTDELAIITDRDLRSRVVAEGRRLETPVAEVMTTPVITVSGDLPAEEALLSMLDHGIHHLPVTDERGSILGVVSDTDLMGLERQSPFAVRAEIDRASDTEGVVRIGRNLGAIVRDLVEIEFDPILVGHVVAATVDALTRRLIEIHMLEHPAPMATWCWIALGSEARHEQAIATDQDHALAFDPVGGAGAEAEADAYFAELARTVADGLQRAGIPRCTGGFMAEHPALRRTQQGWREALPRLLLTTTPKGRIFASLLPDFRAVAGPLEMDTVFGSAIRSVAKDPSFVRDLAIIALETRPPTGFVRDFVVEHGGKHAGTLDVKGGGIVPITALARAYSIGLGLVVNRTVPRLRASAEAGTIQPEAALELEDAFRFLWRVRLEHHVQCLDGGQEIDDRIDPRSLSSLTRVGLKEAFGAIARGQRALALDADLRLR